MSMTTEEITKSIEALPEEQQQEMYRADSAVHWALIWYTIIIQMVTKG